MNGAVLSMPVGPQWFLLFFVIMCLVITGGLSHLGGWASLAKQFRLVQPPIGEQFRFASGSMGKGAFPVSYGGCLFVVVSQSGFALSVLFPFRFQSPPLFIPWTQVESVEDKRLLFIPYVVVRLREHWPLISLRGRAGQRIKEVYASLPSGRVL